MRRLRKVLLAVMVIPALLAVCVPALAESVGYSSLQELSDKRIGVQTGSTFDAITAERLPDAKVEYYNTYADMVEALMSNKIDGFPGDEPVIEMIKAENGDDDPALLEMFDQPEGRKTGEDAPSADPRSELDELDGNT